MKLKPTSLFLVLSLTALCGLLQAQESPKPPLPESPPAAETPRPAAEREEPGSRPPAPEARRGDREGRDAPPETRPDQPERRRPEAGPRDSEPRPEPSQERFQRERNGPPRAESRGPAPERRRDEDPGPPRGPRDMNRSRGQEGHPHDREFRRDEPDSHKRSGPREGGTRREFHPRDPSRDSERAHGPEGRFMPGHRHPMPGRMDGPRDRFDGTEGRRPEFPPRHRQMADRHPERDFRPHMGGDQPDHRPEEHHARGPRPEQHRDRVDRPRHDESPRHHRTGRDDDPRPSGDFRGI